jgi:hypothetical protein
MYIYIFFHFLEHSLILITQSWRVLEYRLTSYRHTCVLKIPLLEFDNFFFLQIELEDIHPTIEI